MEEETADDPSPAASLNNDRGNSEFVCRRLVSCCSETPRILTSFTVKVLRCGGWKLQALVSTLREYAVLLIEFCAEADLFVHSGSQLVQQLHF